MPITITTAQPGCFERRRGQFPRVLSFLALVLALVPLAASAGPREQAKRLHDRLAGVPPTPVVLDTMTTLIEGGDALGAAYEAMQHPAFYNTTVRDLAAPWTNRERSVYVDLNDAIATVIGMVRDDLPFDQLLYEDIVYVGSAAATGIPYSQTNNDHYLDLQLNRVDLSDPANLVQQRQSQLPDTPIGVAQTAGIMTTRGFSEAFLVAGTNRAALRFAALNHLCLDQEDFRDISSHPDRVRQDVSRSPGGDSSIFLNDCLSCHAGLDGLAGGFAFYDFDEDTSRLVYTDGAVQAKYLNDAGVFPYGYETVDDSWINYWRTGKNGFVGWQSPDGGTGSGAKSLGRELAMTRQFAVCQVQNVFRQVCHRSPNGAQDLAAVENIATIFENNNHSMQRVFAETGVHCMGM